MSPINWRDINPTFSLVRNNNLTNCFATSEQACILSGTQPWISSNFSRSSEGDRDITPETGLFAVASAACWTLSAIFRIFGTFFSKGYFINPPQRGLLEFRTHSSGWRHWPQPSRPLNCLRINATSQRENFNIKLGIINIALNATVESWFIFSTKGVRQLSISGLFSPNQSPANANSLFLTL